MLLGRTCYLTLGQLTPTVLCGIILLSIKLAASLTLKCMAKLAEQMSDDEELAVDYPNYLQLRSLHAALLRATVWAGAWLAIGIIILVIGALLRPKAGLFGVDPVGRYFDLQTAPTEAAAAPGGGQ